MSHSIEPPWEEWFQQNLKNGCSSQELINILNNNGFSNEHAQHILDTSQKIIADDKAIGNQLTAESWGNPSSNQSTQQTKHSDAPENPGLFLPTALKLNNTAVEIYGVDGFLSTKECQHLISLIRANRQRSTTTDDGVSQFRTSSTCALDRMEDAIVNDIDRRICQYMGIDTSESEPIQGQWYEVGQEFKAHTDYFDPSSPNFDKHIGKLGQRSWTFMIYLNTTREGGSTFFPELDLNIEPQVGTALIWNNMDSVGRLNASTVHHGTPVVAGYKAIITKWFRSTTPEPRYIKTLNEHIPPLTKEGFVKGAMPEQFHHQLLKFYQQNRLASHEECIPEFINNQNGDVPSVLIQLSDNLQHITHATLQPIVEAWVGDYVTPTHVYGIREYRHGSVLKAHRDRLTTHVASAILNIDQDVSEPWPLVIEDHHCRQHNILLKPGEMILYEGARLQHGRPTALNGNHYANVFVHFKLAEAATLV